MVAQTCSNLVKKMYGSSCSKLPNFGSVAIWFEWISKWLPVGAGNVMQDGIETLSGKIISIRVRGAFSFAISGGLSVRVKRFVEGSRIQVFVVVSRVQVLVHK